jgi:hypothetical protein
VERALAYGIRRPFPPVPGAWITGTPCAAQRSARARVNDAHGPYTCSQSNAGERDKIVSYGCLSRVVSSEALHANTTRRRRLRLGDGYGGGAYETRALAICALAQPARQARRRRAGGPPAQRQRKRRRTSLWQRQNSVLVML